MPYLTTSERIAIRALRALPAMPFTVLTHRWLFGDWTTFRNPATFTEHLQAKKLWDRDPRFTLTADKHAVREWVAERIGKEHLVPLLAVADCPHELDVDALPRAFVIKATHGNGSNLIVPDKSRLDWAADIIKIESWLADNWFRYNKEWAYRAIPPRLIVEEFLGTDGQPPLDYKFFVFRGQVALIQVDSERFVDHQRDFFDRGWRSLGVTLRYPRSVERPARPETLPEMLRIAERLGREFAFARIDLYDHDGAVLFGEVTHYPEGGTARWEPAEFDAALGRMWQTGEIAIPRQFYDPEVVFPAAR